MTPRLSSACTGLIVVALLAGGCQSLDRVVYKNRSSTTVSKEYVGKPPAVAPPVTTGAKAPRQTQVDPAQAALAKAEALAKAGNPDAALSEFEKAIEINPTLTVAYLGAGDIYREKGDYHGAERNYGKAANLEPGNFSAQYLHGLSLQLLERFGEAVRAYLRALQLRPDDFNANLNLGTTYIQLGEPAQALSFAQKAVQLNPSSAEARTNLGAAYSILDRHEEAVIEFQQAGELTDLSAPLLLNLANSLGRIRRYDEMVNTLTQLTKSEPTANAYERLGAGLFHLRRYDESLTAYRKALDIDPNHYPALNGVGVCLMNQWVFSKQTDEAARQQALAAWRRSVQIERDQPKIMELIGRFK